MKEVQYNIIKIISKVCRVKNQKLIHSFFKKNGIELGSECRIYSNIVTSESNLIVIGDNVTISSEVLLITHDNSICKVNSNYTDVFGKIVIGNNCFIGARSTILYGVKLADSIIVAAGSVVTKSFEENNIIIAGNPAKKIGVFDSFEEKYRDYAFDLREMSKKERQTSIISKLVEK